MEGEFSRGQAELWPAADWRVIETQLLFTAAVDLWCRSNDGLDFPVDGRQAASCSPRPSACLRV